ncbi:WD40-repeat-containing domain protein [Kockovaella imperatae]|uniref:WD40-repeat-containing domain protein n=1 Tax=Kockovaella imperatae TaxID=4999 RepID=A0A1Y1UPE1_9TREE|nr:WD40-repeat-containing domain protein [Kockovaella imperatae]ORX39005.1 WD40-repeat-containing domain protein [Kockovaella imperatae]
MINPYAIRQLLRPAHVDDVKVVLAVSNDCIASGSRDGSIGIWKLETTDEEAGSSSSFQLKALLGGHGAYVNSLAYIPNGDPSSAYIASGGNSTMILLHSLETLDPESTHALLGHSLNVCTLSYSPQRSRLISGSWDKTARVWKKHDLIDHDESNEALWATELLLEGHVEAVWGVAIVEEGPKAGHYLTGEACDPSDRLINLWDPSGNMLLRIKGSPEPVRSISMDGNTFISACNDGLVRRWDMTGSVLQIYRGHTDYVYHVVARDGQIVSCGEDHSARVWASEPEARVLLHPCQSVWSADILPNGDIVTGGSDGVVRVWTADSGRTATEEAQNAYELEVEEGMKLFKQEKVADATSANVTTKSPQSLTIDIDIRRVYGKMELMLSDDADPIPLTISVGGGSR